MVHTTNPTAPVDVATPHAPSNDTTGRVPSRPSARPMSARPRMTTCGDKTSLRSSGPMPRAPQTARPSTAGVRRKRQANGEPLNMRIRAVYSDVRGGSGSTPRMGASVSPSHTASSVIQSRQRIFQEAELQHEYHRLVDMVNDLRTVVQHEQSQRLKAMARVRRLEEIVTMKDRKIEGLLHGHSIGISSHDPASSAAQREMAQRERHHHNMMQKLRHKLAQQNQLVASYEEAMQTLRASLKSTHLMEIEEENKQLQIEIARLNEILARQEDEKQYFTRQIADLKAGESHFRTQLAKSHQELKRSDHERRKLEQEALLLRATVQQLEQRLALEQKKRAYDHVVASKRSPTVVKSPRFVVSGSSPFITRDDSSASLAEALAEMRMLRAPSSPTMNHRRPTPKPRELSPPSPATSDEDNGDGGLSEPPDDALAQERSRVLTSVGVLKKPDSPRSADANKRKQVRWTEDASTDIERELEEAVGSPSEQVDSRIETDRRSEDTQPASSSDREQGSLIQRDTEESTDTDAIDDTTSVRGRQDDDRDVESDNATRLSDPSPPTGQRESASPSAQREVAAPVDSSSYRTESSSSSSPSAEPSTSPSSSTSDLEAFPRPPSSSGSSSLASLLAREDAATMAAEASLHDSADTPPSSQLAYDSDFSDDENASDEASNPPHSC